MPLLIFSIHPGSGQALRAHPGAGYNRPLFQLPIWPIVQELPPDRPLAARPEMHCAAHQAVHATDTPTPRKKALTRIRELAESIRGACGLVCVHTDFQVVCEARDIGLASTLSCSAHEGCGCPFRLALSFGQFCQCPIRVQIAKSLRI